MSKTLDIVAKALSVIFYPLFVPTYGMALFCYAYQLHVSPMPFTWVLVALLGTFLLTCFCPITAIWILMKHGHVQDLQIDSASERTMPYIYSAVSFGCWAYLLICVLHSPAYLGFIGVGATVAIALVALINRRWKISAHLTGFGGLFGGLMSYCLGVGAIPTSGTLTLWLSLTLLLMYARLRLNAHTGAQVSAGWLLGITCTFIPYCIYCYVA